MKLNDEREECGQLAIFLSFFAVFFGRFPGELPEDRYNKIASVVSPEILEEYKETLEQYLTHKE